MRGRKTQNRELVARRKSWTKRAGKRWPWMRGYTQWKAGTLCDQFGTPMIDVRRVIPRLAKSTELKSTP
jgi:hypothetical protein